MKKLVLAGTLLFVLPLGAADAMLRYCSQPMAPSLGFISKPSKPYCAATRTCSDWDVSSYKSDVEQYFRKLKRYAEEVDTYYVEAGDYVKCMADLD
jgi:hypothetical protein